MSSSRSAEVRAVVAHVLGQLLKREIGPSENVTRENEERWNSLMQVELAFTVEDACDVTFKPEQLETLTSLDAIVDAVIERRSQAAE